MTDVKYKFKVGDKVKALKYPFDGELFIVANRLVYESMAGLKVFYVLESRTMNPVMVVKLPEDELEAIS